MAQHENELATLRAELDQRGPAPPSIEAVCVQLNLGLQVSRMSLRVLLGGLPFWITLGKRKRLH